MNVDGFLELYRLKDLARTGWVLRGVVLPESVADHSWGTALLALRYAGEAAVDTERSLTLAVVHDLVEVRVGDIPRRADPRVPAVSEEQKRSFESDAARELTEELPWPELFALWEEYDRGVTGEAQFVRDMNLVDMVLQALFYAREQRWSAGAGEDRFPTFPGVQEFFETSRSRVTTPVGKRLYQAVESAYLSLRGDRG